MENKNKNIMKIIKYSCYIFFLTFIVGLAVSAQNMTSCVYTYSEWSPCASSGAQTRTVISKSPADCYSYVAPILEQKCIYNEEMASFLASETSTESDSVAGTQIEPIACVYAYSDWSVCIKGKQVRKITSTSPSGCSDSIAPVVERTCLIKPLSCIYEYSQWSGCNYSGVEERKLVSKTPEGCYQFNNPELERHCLYNPITTATSVNATSAGADITACVYNYSDWSHCIEGKQTRMVISKSPADCHDIKDPYIRRFCESKLAPTTITPVNIPAPKPESVSLPVATSTNMPASNFNERTSIEWQKYYFGSADCLNSDICSGSADYDKDGLSNNEEYRFGTNPKDSDTDRDARVDAEEIQIGRNPLIAGSKTVSDVMVFESPKDKGEIKKELYQIKNIESVSRKGGSTILKISGKALPNIYVTVYIYSNPIVLTVKTDSDGNWSYILDKPLEDGKHEIYVAVTDNTGKISAKSEPVEFVQSAAAIEIIPSLKASVQDEEKSPTKASLEDSYLLFILAGVAGLILSLLAIGLIISGNKKSKEDGMN